MAKRGAGEGSFWRTKAGRWRGRVTINGVTVTSSGATRREAENALTLRKAEVLSGASKPAGKAAALTVSRWAVMWLSMCTSRLDAGTLKASTVDSYANLLERYVLPFLGPIQLDKLTANHVLDWHADLLAKGYKPGTVAGAHRVLRAMLREAERQEKVTRNAASLAGGPRGVEPVHEFLSLVEVGKVVAAFDGTRSAAAVALGLLGLRRGEIAGMSWADVDLDRGLVTVRENLVAVAGRSVRGTPKRKASYRTISADEALIEALRRWRTRQLEERVKAGPRWVDTGAVITTRHGTPMDPPNLAREMSRFVLEACGRSISPHGLRHTSASLMYDAGADVKAISEHLGHGDTSVTERIYTHLLSAARRRGGDALGRALKTASDTPR